jgi:hypothetical protein
LDFFGGEVSFGFPKTWKLQGFKRILSRDKRKKRKKGK